MIDGWQMCVPDERDRTGSADGLVPLAAMAPLARRSPEALLTALGGAEPFLLESGKGGTGHIGRYSFLGSDPRFSITADGHTVHLRGRDGGSADADPAALADSDDSASLESPMNMGPLALMRRVLARHRVRRPANFPPFVGGFCGVFSYDLVRRFERLPESATDDLRLPHLDVGFYDQVVAVDHRDDRLWVIHLPCFPDANADAGHGGANRVRDRMAATMARLDRASVNPAGSGVVDQAGDEAAVGTGPIAQAEMSPDAFRDMVRAAQRLIAAGDLFQANLSQRFRAPRAGRCPRDLYRALRRLNPAPFSAYFDRGAYQVVSSSPERLVSLTDGVASARPIAGTRPRGADAEGDRQRREDLMSNAKERAEHLMLVDLMRNDLGRVCAYGSIAVDEFMSTEDYSHVMHIVSNVTGRLAPGKDALSLLRAVFPGGTITGAPKVRCMEVIDDLEPVRRGFYTGSAGYLSASGDMDLNILIRTLLIAGDSAYVQTGAGVVADSDPDAEYHETLHKAAAMQQALAQVPAVSAAESVAMAGGRA